MAVLCAVAMIEEVLMALPQLTAVDIQLIASKKLIV